MAVKEEIAASKGNTKVMYSIWEKLSDKFKQQNKHIIDKEGKKLTNMEEQEKTDG